MHEFKYFTAKVVLCKVVCWLCEWTACSRERGSCFLSYCLAILVTHLCSRRNALLRLVLICVFHSLLSLAVRDVRNYLS